VKRITLGVLTWLIAVTTAHLALNVNWSVLMNDRMPEGKQKLNVAYIPVT